MLLLILFCAFVSATTTVDNSSNYYPSDGSSMVFRKCCPKEQLLVKVYRFDTEYSEVYECISSDPIENNFNISLSHLLIGENVEVQDSFPTHCDNLQVIQHTHVDFNLLVWDNKCYDRLGAEVVNGTLKQNIPKTVTLICNQTETENKYRSKLNIDHLRKCCPKGQSYDMVFHVCRHSDQIYDEQALLKRLKVRSDYIYEVELGLACKFDEYAIDLHERNFSFVLDGSILTTASKNKKYISRLTQGEWCIDQEYNSDHLIAQVCSSNCAAFGAFCVRKCCPPGHHFRTRSCASLASDCVPYVDEKNFFNLSYHMDDSIEVDEHLFDTTGFRNGLLCPHGKYVLNKSLALDQFVLNTNGYLDLVSGQTNEYCLEVFDRRACASGDIIRNGLLCFIKEKKIKDFRLSFVVISISCVCLVLTLVVYVTIPELRNLHGRNLISHVSMMLVAYCCLARVQYSSVPDNLHCTLLGYTIYFAFMAAFAWLNVMCFDIWWTFGSVRTVQPLRKSTSERRRFIWYSMYAWSIAVLLTGTTYLLDRYPISYNLDSNIGNYVCWFGAKQNTSSDWPHYILFVFPMGVFTCTNFVLWLLTARHCAQVKSEMHRLQAGSVGDRAKRRFRIDRAKYILTGKLWVVMGAGWVSELLSTILAEPLWLWNIVDLINELQGVLIFIILVVKPKLYYLMKKRLGCSSTPINPRLQKPDTQKNGTTSSGRTSSTFLSRTISTEERAQLKVTCNNPKQV